MAFLYKAFIRKNTPELRAKLEDLGYTNGAWETPRFHYPYLSVFPNQKFEGEVKYDWQMTKKQRYLKIKELEKKLKTIEHDKNGLITPKKWNKFIITK